MTERDLSRRLSNSPVPPPPADLADRIVADIPPEVELHPAIDREETRRSLYRRSVWMAAAAVVTVALTAAVTWELRNERPVIEQAAAPASGRLPAPSMEPLEKERYEERTENLEAVVGETTVREHQAAPRAKIAAPPPVRPQPRVIEVQRRSAPAPIEEEAGAPHDDTPIDTFSFKSIGGRAEARAETPPAASPAPPARFRRKTVLADAAFGTASKREPVGASVADETGRAGSPAPETDSFALARRMLAAGVLPPPGKIKVDDFRAAVSPNDREGSAPDIRLESAAVDLARILAGEAPFADLDAVLEKLKILQSENPGNDPSITQLTEMVLQARAAVPGQ